MVERIEPVRVDGPDILATSELMSPYVWREPDGILCVLIRVVPAPDDPDNCTGRIWLGEAKGEDGLHFVTDDRPLLMPDPDGLDRLGCEDPTVIRLKDEIIVYYTGVRGAGENELLWASGPDIRALEKHGIALDSFRDEYDVKEAEIAVKGGRWTMAYEYAHDDASSVGLAEADGPSGPWREIRVTHAARKDHWDSWHISPGPLLFDDPDRPVMFYNGATHDAVWAIGWVMYDRAKHTIVDRCDEPLIAPPGEDRGRNIAFSASLIEDGDRLHLYFTQNDRTLHRATVRRG